MLRWLTLWQIDQLIVNCDLLLLFNIYNIRVVKMVLVSKENRRKIYEYLLKEGVIVVKKDSYLPKH